MEHASIAVLIILALFVCPIVFHIYRAVKGKEIFIRRIPGLDAIDEAIGRSVELGRPIVFTPALTGIGPLFAACLGVLRHIAKKTAIFSSRLYVPCADPEALVLADVTVQNAYKSQKRYSSYDPSCMRYLSSEQFAFASGYMGLVQREQPGATFLFGSFAAESLILAEAGQKVGAIQVAATTDVQQIPFFITACDYTLIGEELYAAGAYLGTDPVQRGSIRGQDFAKLVIIFLIFIGVGVSTYYSITKKDPKTNPVTTWLNSKSEEGENE
ncbi:MAG: hypothetical protein KBC84_02880 [Proteobacteria bacterium]|nr:hypothetical protein [Pseudomonadota bacterium]